MVDHGNTGVGFHTSRHVQTYRIVLYLQRIIRTLWRFVAVSCAYFGNFRYLSLRGRMAESSQQQPPPPNEAPWPSDNSFTGRKRRRRWEGCAESYTCPKQSPPCSYWSRPRSTSSTLSRERTECPASDRWPTYYLNPSHQRDPFQILY